MATRPRRPTWLLEVATVHAGGGREDLHVGVITDDDGVLVGLAAGTELSAELVVDAVLAAREHSPGATDVTLVFAPSVADAGVEPPPGGFSLRGVRAPAGGGSVISLLGRGTVDPDRLPASRVSRRALRSWLGPDRNQSKGGFIPRWRSLRLT